MQEKPAQPAEGKLLKDAVKASGTSVRAAALKVGLSDTRLRQILNGYIPLGSGQFAEVSAPAETLARIAIELGISAESMAATGRADAAAIMVAWQGRRDLHKSDLARESEDDVLARQEMRAWLDRNPGDLVDDWDPPTLGLRLFSTAQLFEALADRYNEMFADLRAANRRIHRGADQVDDGEPAMAWRIVVEEQETPEHKAWSSAPERVEENEAYLRAQPELRRELQAVDDFYSDEDSRGEGGDDDGLADQQQKSPEPPTGGILRGLPSRKPDYDGGDLMQTAAYEGDAGE